MSIKYLSHAERKKLYIQKLIAIEKKDINFLIELQQQYPELFDKQFLYEMLQTELKEKGEELPEQLERLLQEIIDKKPMLQ